MCARSRRPFFLGLTLPLVAAALAGAAQAPDRDDDPLLGHWRLVVEESLYKPGPPPRSQRRTYERSPQGLRTVVLTVTAEGESSTVEYTTNYDSIEYRITGAPSADGIALRKVDAHTAEATLRHAGRVIGTAQRVVSADGQRMTITFRDTRGVVHNRAVYVKEERQK